jgi:hypothetical protein
VIDVRKRIVGRTPGEAAAPAGEEWLDLERLATVEVSSEDPEHPVEEALLPGRERGWRAAGPGEQVLRLVLDEPRRLRRIQLVFAEPAAERTQEFSLRWRAADGAAREIVRQQWTFSPSGSTRELEDYRVDLAGVSSVELVIVPDVAGGEARASLRLLRLA